MIKEILKDVKEEPREKLTLQLDSDIVDFFRSLDGYDEIINGILREHVKTARLAES